MRYIFCSGIVLTVLFLIACSGSIKVVGQEPKAVYNNEGRPERLSLSAEDARKFEYFFYEGNRYKALGDAQKSVRYYAEALKIDSTCAACCYELGRLLLSSENFGDAEKFLEQAVRFDPQNRWYIELLARVYQNNKKGEKAVTTAAKLLNKPSVSVEEIYFVAQLQIENEQYESAIQNLERIENILGFNEGLVLEKYQLYLQNGDFRNAEKVLAGLIKEYPRNSDYYLYLGDFYLEQLKYNKAYDNYEKTQSVDPDNGKVFFSLANYHLQRKEYNEFKSYFLKAIGAANISFEAKFQRIIPFLMKLDDDSNPLDSTDVENLLTTLTETHPFEPKSYVVHANYLVSANRNKDAIPLFEKALDIDAQLNEVWQDYLFLLSGIDNNEKMLAKSREALTFFPDNPFFHMFHGVSLYQEENLSGALEAFKKGLSLVEDNRGLQVQFHAYMGDIYHSLGDIENSFSNYENALAIDENNLIVLNNYSYYLSLIGKELDKAERMSAKTVELDPGNSTYLDTYAWVLFKRGRYLEAKFIIERAVDNLESPSGLILEHYGDILFKNGDVAEALNIWNKAAGLEDHSELLMKKIEEERYIDENH